MTDDPLAPPPAEAAWYDEHEDDFVESAISMIRVYQYKMPDGIGPYYHWEQPWTQDWWTRFWEMLEREAVVKQRRLFINRWKERNQPGGRQRTLDMLDRHDPERCPYIVAGQQDLDAYADGGPPGGVGADG